MIDAPPVSQVGAHDPVVVLMPMPNGKQKRPCLSACQLCVGRGDTRIGAPWWHKNPCTQAPAAMQPHALAKCHFAAQRLAIFASHSECLWAIRRRPKRFPIRSQIFRIRDGEQLSFIVPDGYCPIPSTNGMVGPAGSGGIVPGANDVLEN